MLTRATFGSIGCLAWSELVRGQYVEFSLGANLDQT